MELVHKVAKDGSIYLCVYSTKGVLLSILCNGKVVSKEELDAKELIRYQADLFHGITPPGYTEIPV